MVQKALGKINQTGNNTLLHYNFQFLISISYRRGDLWEAIRNQGGVSSLKPVPKDEEKSKPAAAGGMIDDMQKILDKIAVRVQISDSESENDSDTDDSDWEA